VVVRWEKNTGNEPVSHLENLFLHLFFVSVCMKKKGLSSEQTFAKVDPSKYRKNWIKSKVCCFFFDFSFLICTKFFCTERITFFLLILYLFFAFWMNEF